MVPVSEPVLSIQNFSVYYPSGHLNLFSRGRRVPAVVDCSFNLPEGTITGLVGESGCGKSSLGRALVGLIPDIEGEVKFEGVRFDPRNDPEIRRKMQIIFQDPFGSLNPRQTIGQALMEIEKVILNSHDQGKTWELLEAVQLPRSCFNRYPHELSGGQRQRACIARALAVNPKVLICDEIVSSLDVSLQAKIINLLLDLRSSRSLTILFTTHDLNLVEVFCDYVVVMYRGRIMEQGSVQNVFSTPRHPYTKDLLAAVQEEVLPDGISTTEETEQREDRRGCEYQYRCSKWNGAERKDAWQCSQIEPEQLSVGDNHIVFCTAVKEKQFRVSSDVNS